ncbi:MAG TPA: glycosyltransferase [Pyrinomonadaceae bacterium]|nr:glycosyltransferase [Pyrinomonadaceae bacterium]
MKISVIIPVRNEETSIGDLINALLNQTLKPAEIVITDGGSSDATPAIISEFIASGAPVRLLRETAALPGRGRNLAAAQAANEWLAFVDAGTSPEPDWLELLARCVQSTDNVDVVYGSYAPIANTLFKRCAVMAYVTPPVLIEKQLVWTRSVVSLLMRRSVWQAVGGFPENLRSGEDLLFLNKIEQGSFRIANAPAALVHWQVQPTPWLTFKRFVIYARNNMSAGLWRDWQAAIFIRYFVVLICALPILFVGARWLPLTVLVWLLMLAARAAVRIWRNRACFPVSVFESISRMLVLVPLIALLDAATFLGTLQWAVKDKFGL